jgi:hypothetical protein
MENCASSIPSTSSTVVPLARLSATRGQKKYNGKKMNAVFDMHMPVKSRKPSFKNHLTISDVWGSDV